MGKYVSTIPFQKFSREINDDLMQIVGLISRIFLWNYLWGKTTPQCGNNENLLSRFFAKNFVKATHLLNKSLKSWFDGKKTLVRVNFSYFNSMCTSPLKWQYMEENSAISILGRDLLTLSLFCKSFVKSMHLSAVFTKYFSNENKFLKHFRERVYTVIYICRCVHRVALFYSFARKSSGTNKKLKAQDFTTETLLQNTSTN